MRKLKTKLLSETIGDWQYFRGKNGELCRALASQPIETRLVHFVTLADHAEFALRSARLSAGLPEFGKGVVPPYRQVRRTPARSRSLQV